MYYNDQIKHIKELCKLSVKITSPTRKFIFLKRCPECEGRLEKASFAEQEIGNIFSTYEHFRCLQCDYEYAKCTLE